MFQPAGNTIYKLLQIYGTFLILLTATIILSEAKLLHEGNPVYFVLGVIIFSMCYYDFRKI